MRVVSGRGGWPNGMMTSDRVSGCMSVAGYTNGFHFRLMVRVRGSRRGKCAGREAGEVRRETRKWLDKRALGIDKLRIINDE